MDASSTARHIPWNKGKLTRQKPPLKLREIWGIRIRLQLAGEARDLALFNLAIDSQLRGCDLVRLRVLDISHQGGVMHRAITVQRKTGRPVQFELTDQTRQSVAAWLRHAGRSAPDYLFPGRRRPQGHLSTRQYARLVQGWASSIGLDPAIYGTHSLRRTKPTLIYRQTKNLRAVLLLLGHTKLERTVRYLGIELEDALEIAEGTDA